MSNLLEVYDLAKSFHYRTGLFRSQTVEAVKPLSFSLKQQQTLAIIGENGSGKSTLAKLIVGMLQPTQGDIYINGQRLTFNDYPYRTRHIRMILQNPHVSFNPRQQIGKLLDTPLKLNTSLSNSARAKQIFETLKLVGLTKDHAYYYPSMLASGQLQQVAFARALILRPQIIIADDAFTALDMSIRSQLINIMLELQNNFGISYIYVTQHLGMMKHISDQVLVMQEGEIIERGNTAEVLAAPLHEITHRLISGHFGGRLKADLWRREEDF